MGKYAVTPKKADIPFFFLIVNDFVVITFIYSALCFRLAGVAYRIRILCLSTFIQKFGVNSVFRRN